MARFTDWRALAADYGSYHKSQGNRLTHMVGIPLIVLAVVRWTQIGSPLPWAAAVLPLYLVWAPGLALAMAAMLAAMAWLAPQMSAAAIWTCFVLGWILQLVGHKLYEGRSPAFMKNLLHLLVGPLWILGEALPFLDPSARK